MDHLTVNGTVDDARNELERQSVTADDIPRLLASVKDTPATRKRLRELNIEITRSQIRESVTTDAHLVHAITAIDEIDKVANILAKRLRAWYALHDPELEKRTPDHREFAAAVLAAPERVANTMGGATQPADLAAALAHAKNVQDLYAHRDALVAHLEERLKVIAPNIARVAGTTIGAKLIAIAGSLNRLAGMTSGTVQLLGAETALFRHLRNPNARPPKHGVIFMHQVLQNARVEDRGRIARALADAITIAARIDRFAGEFAGDTLLAKVQARADELRARTPKPKARYEPPAYQREDRRGPRRGPPRQQGGRRY